MGGLAILSLDHDTMAAGGRLAGIASGEFAELAGQTLGRLAPPNVTGADALARRQAALEPYPEMGALLVSDDQRPSM